MEEFTVNEERRKVLGKELSKNRKAKNITIKEEAEKLGISDNYIEKLEKGKIRLINPFILIKLGEILEINYILLYQIV